MIDINKQYINIIYIKDQSDGKKIYYHFAGNEDNSFLLCH